MCPDQREEIKSKLTKLSYAYQVNDAQLINAILRSTASIAILLSRFFLDDSRRFPDSHFICFESICGMELTRSSHRIKAHSACQSPYLPVCMSCVSLLLDLNESMDLCVCDTVCVN